MQTHRQLNLSIEAEGSLKVEDNTLRFWVQNIKRQQSKGPQRITVKSSLVGLAASFNGIVHYTASGQLQIQRAMCLLLQKEGNNRQSVTVIILAILVFFCYSKRISEIKAFFRFRACLDLVPILIQRSILKTRERRSRLFQFQFGRNRSRNETTAIPISNIIMYKVTSKE